MEQLEVFTANSPIQLQRRLNAWLKDNGDRYRILARTQSSALTVEGDLITTVIIWYVPALPF